MSKHLPPIQPASRSAKGTGGAEKLDATDARRDRRERNFAEQEQQGNIHQNTTNQGYQQDR